MELVHDAWPLGEGLGLGTTAAPVLYTSACVSVGSESPGLVSAYETAPRAVWTRQASAPWEAHGRPVQLRAWGAGLRQPLAEE